MRDVTGPQQLLGDRHDVVGRYRGKAASGGGQGDGESDEPSRTVEHDAVVGCEILGIGDEDTALHHAVGPHEVESGGPDDAGADAGLAAGHVVHRNHPMADSGLAADLGGATIG